MAGSNVKSDTLNVYLIGNNPIELSDVHQKLNSVKDVKFVAEIGFEIRDLVRNIQKFNPACILVDDNLGKQKFASLLQKLGKRAVTRNIPIAVLKSSNTELYPNTADDFLLKSNVTGDRLTKAIRNSIRLRKMKVSIGRKYYKSKRSLVKWLN